MGPTGEPQRESPVEREPRRGMTQLSHWEAAEKYNGRDGRCTSARADNLYCQVLRGQVLDKTTWGWRGPPVPQRGCGEIKQSHVICATCAPVFTLPLSFCCTFPLSRFHPTPARRPGASGQAWVTRVPCQQQLSCSKAPRSVPNVSPPLALFADPFFFSVGYHLQVWSHFPCQT